MFVMRSSCAVTWGGTECKAWNKTKKALGNFDTGCVNSTLSLEILQFLVFNVFAVLWRLFIVDLIVLYLYSLG